VDEGGPLCISRFLSIVDRHANDSDIGSAPLRLSSDDLNFKRIDDIYDEFGLTPRLRIDRLCTVELQQWVHLYKNFSSSCRSNPALKAYLAKPLCQLPFQSRIYNELIPMVWLSDPNPKSTEDQAMLWDSMTCIQMGISRCRACEGRTRHRTLHEEECCTA